jgi:Iap family predicted aminopeptidase
MRAAAATFLIAALLSACGSFGGECDGDAACATENAFDEDRAFADLEAQVEIGPRPSGSRGARKTRELIRERLEEAGVATVAQQHPYANLIGGLPGSEPGVVVVGAHYDTKSGIPGFLGANDGASGVAVLLELARTLPRPLPGPAVQLVFFDAEEARGDRPFESDGLRGSRQYVEYARAGGRQGSAPLDQLRAMVLFDLVGDCELEIPLEASSDPALYELFRDAGGGGLGGGPAPFEGRTGPIADDHVPFLEAGIPAFDLIDFDFGPGPTPGAYWHTAEDTLDKVCPASLDAVGGAALVAIPGIR